MSPSKLDVIQTAAQVYVTQLKTFLEKNGLDSGMYALPVDHVAIKMADSHEYEVTMQEIIPLAKEGCVAHLNNRRIATLELAQPFDLGPFGQTVWLEIMEPRPEKVGKDFVGFEHVELIIQDETALKDCFTTRGLTPEICQNTYHRAYAFKINEQGQEVKFTNNPLAKVVQDELNAGTAESVV